MPFEKLMEHVAALSEPDWNLKLGELAKRWGEPASRIGDAIDAVRVMNGERTYIPVDVPAEPEPEQEPCRGFRWIGQSFKSCDGCGRPAWEHEGELRLRDGSSPFGVAEGMKRKWGG